MSNPKPGSGRHAWRVVAASSVLLSACAHTPEPGEEVAECGPLYQLRAKQISPPDSRAGVAIVHIVTADEYENIPDIHVRLSSPTGQFYVNGSPRQFAFTDTRGNLVVEWHAPESVGGGTSEAATVSFQALDLPGDCSVELTVDPPR